MKVRFGRWFGSWFAARRASSRARVVAAIVAVVLLLESGAVLLVPLMRTQAAETTRVGVFAALYVHSEDGSPPLRGGTLYTLIEDSGAMSERLVGEAVLRAAGGVGAVDGRRVVVTAEVPIAPQGASQAPPIFVRSLAPERGPAIVPQVVAGSRAFLNVLCRFAGSATAPQPPSYFDSLMGAANPLGIDAYWREVSYNAIAHRLRIGGILCLLGTVASSRVSARR